MIEKAKHAVFNMLVFVSAIPLMVMSWFAIQKVDENFFPPVIGMQAIDYEKSPEKIRVHVVGRKIRDCKPLQVQGWYETPNGHIPMQINFERAGGRTGKNPRHLKKIGYHDFGWWTLTPSPVGGYFKVSILYECNPFYNQTVILGPFTYEKFFARKDKIRSENLKKTRRFLGLDELSSP